MEFPEDKIQRQLKNGEIDEETAIMLLKSLICTLTDVLNGELK